MAIRKDLQKVKRVKPQQKLDLKKILDEDLRVKKNTNIKIAVEDLELKSIEFKKEFLREPTKKEILAMIEEMRKGKLEIWPIAQQPYEAENLSVKIGGKKCVEVSWNIRKYNGVTYELQRALMRTKSEGLFYQTIYKLKVDKNYKTSIQYEDYDLKEGETYYYRVKTVCQNASVNSKSVFIKFKGNPPSSVTQFSCSVHPYEKQVNLSWKTAANALEYKVYRAHRDGDFVPIATTKGTQYNDSDLKLQVKETYRYYVIASNEWGTSSDSGIKTICFVGATPEAPKTFSASVSATKKEVNLSWSMAVNALEYKIYRAYGNGKFVLIATTEEKKYVDTDSELKVNETYRYSVRSSNEWGESSYPSVRSICFKGKIPDVPKNLQVASEDGVITLYWQCSQNALSYYVKKKEINSTMEWSKEIPCTSCSYTDKNVIKDRGYYYRVCALNEWGCSDYCEEKPAWPKSVDYAVNRKGIIIAVTVPTSDSDYKDEKKRREVNCNNISNTFKKNGIESVIVFNRSLEQLNTELMNFAKQVDTDDVSYIYVNCHSGTNAIGIGYTDKNIQYISLQRVRELLDQIPGRKILLFETCHSGQAIAEDKKNSSSTTTRTIKKEEDNQSALFLQNMISVFQTKKKTLERSNNMRRDEYYVLCSSTEDELSYGNSKYGNRATKYWCKGGGWNYKEHKECKYYADSNGNDVVTLEELYKYSYDKVVKESEDKQHVVRWPEGSTEKVFGK